ncbi:MAG: VOC family protein [Anaerolineae bacterium]
MQFGYTIIYVPDVKKAAEFYARAFNLTVRFVSDENDYGEMDTGGTTLAFAANHLGKSNLPDGFRENRPNELPAGIEIAFVTPDVQAAYDHAVKTGAVAVSAPVTKPWGQVVAYVRDLNGVAVELASPMG